MFNVPEFLDRAKVALAKKMGLASVTDYRLAKHIGYQPPTLYGWRSEKSAPDERAILQLCALTGDDPVDVAVRIQSMRAANDDAADLWRRVAARLQGGFADVMLMVILATTFVAGRLVADSAVGAALSAAVSESVYYVKWYAAWRLIELARLWWSCTPVRTDSCATHP